MEELHPCQATPPPKLGTFSLTSTCHILKDRHGNSFKHLLLLFKLLFLCSLVGIKPCGGLVNRIKKNLLVISRNLVLDFLSLNGRLERVAVVLQEAVLGFDMVLVGVIFYLVLLGFLNQSAQLMVILFSFPVGFLSADTFKIPLESVSGTHQFKTGKS